MAQFIHLQPSQIFEGHSKSDVMYVNLANILCIECYKIDNADKKAKLGGELIDADNGIMVTFVNGKKEHFCDTYEDVIFQIGLVNADYGTTKQQRINARTRNGNS